MFPKFPRYYPYARQVSVGLSRSPFPVAVQPPVGEPYTACFIVDLFKNQSELEIADKAIYHMVEALASIDTDFINRFPNTPTLYQSGIRYRTDNPYQSERWKTIPVLLSERLGDCKDLASYLIGDYRARSNVHAIPKILHNKLSDGRHLYHVQVQLPNGQIEDPSARLGMKP